MTTAMRTIRASARKLRNRTFPGGLILLYHRVAELPCDPLMLAVTPGHFTEHLEVLNRIAQPAALGALAAVVRHGQTPRRQVAMTFDDGYADNLHQALPALSRHEIPATVFVSSDAIKSGREFFWDELDKVLLQSLSLPRSLALTIDGQRHEWDLGAPRSDEGMLRLLESEWKITDRLDPTPRHRAYRELFALLRPRPDNLRRRVLDDLHTWAGLSTDCRPTHRALAAAELRTLADHPLIEIGGHTATHAHLAGMHPDRQQDEIESGKADVEAILGRPLVSFSYPFGGRGDYSRQTPGLVRQAGFALACSNRPGTVRRDANVFELPRFLVRDWDGDQFARQLREWGHA